MRICIYALTCPLNVCFDGYLVCIHLVLFLFVKISSLGLSTNTSIEVSPRFLGFCSIPLDRYPDPPSQIIWSLCLLNSTSIYRDFLPSITPRCLSIYRAAFFIYSLRSNPILLFLKYFDFSLSSRDLNISLSLKSLFPSNFQPYPSLLHLVSVLNLFFSLVFMHSCIFLPKFSSFFGKLLGFL